MKRIALNKSNRLNWIKKPKTTLKITMTDFAMILWKTEDIF